MKMYVLYQQKGSERLDFGLKEFIGYITTLAMEKPSTNIRNIISGALPSSVPSSGG
jgi:hypothetical protein